MENPLIVTNRRIEILDNVKISTQYGKRIKKLSL